MRVNLAEALHNDGMLYFILGSLISSDSIFSKEDAEKAIDTLANIEQELDCSALEESVKSEYKERIKKCYKVLESDLKRFE